MSGLKIGEVARRAGVTPDTIRYYERLGVIPRAARTPAGYRQYASGAVQRLLLVRNAQRFGFSLAQIGRFLNVRDRGGAPCRDVRAAAQRMLEEIDRQIAALLATRREMAATLDDWDRKLTMVPSGEPARLLEGLTGRAGRDAALAPHPSDRLRSAARARSRHDGPSTPQLKCS